MDPGNDARRQEWDWYPQVESLVHTSYTSHRIVIVITPVQLKVHDVPFPYMLQVLSLQGFDYSSPCKSLGMRLALVEFPLSAYAYTYIACSMKANAKCG